MRPVAQNVLSTNGMKYPTAMLLALPLFAACAADRTPSIESSESIDLADSIAVVEQSAAGDVHVDLVARDHAFLASLDLDALSGEVTISDASRATTFGAGSLPDTFLGDRSVPSIIDALHGQWLASQATEDAYSFCRIWCYNGMGSYWTLGGAYKNEGGTASCDAGASGWSGIGWCSSAQ